MWIINSYVNIELDKAIEKYNEINENITKEIMNESKKYQETLTDSYKHMGTSKKPQISHHIFLY